MYLNDVQFTYSMDICMCLNHVYTLYMDYVHCDVFLYSNASYNVGDYYAGSQNDTTTNVYYLNNFDDLLRSYGECGGREGGRTNTATEKGNRDHINDHVPLSFQSLSLF